jgi:hypothetical protein
MTDELQTTVTFPRRPEAEVPRFWAKVRKSDGCWEWQASLVDGYGRFYRFGSIKAKAHRVSYEMENGPIPNGLLVCHHCDNRKCVRPDHLFLGTNLDNMRDARAKGRFAPPPITWANSPHSHCRQGHALTQENRVRSGGCRRCNNTRRAAWARQKRAAMKAGAA